MKGQEGDKVRKNKRLEKYGISQDRHMELRYFCKQYPQKKEQLLESMTCLKGVSYNGMPSGNQISNTTEKLALKMSKLKEDIEIIERSAITANSSFYKAIIENVTQGIDYFYLNVPCSKRYFYRAVENFYIILNENKI